MSERDRTVQRARHIAGYGILYWSPHHRLHPAMADYRHIACRIENGIAAVTFPTGRFDGHAVRELFELSNQLPAARPMLLVDCGGVDMVPSGGMGMLITIHKRFLGVGGQLHIAVPGPNVMRSFRVANMQRLLSLYETSDQARSAFKR